MITKHSLDLIKEWLDCWYWSRKEMKKSTNYHCKYDEGKAKNTKFCTEKLLSLMLRKLNNSQKIMYHFTKILLLKYKHKILRKFFFLYYRCGAINKLNKSHRGIITYTIAAFKNTKITPRAIFITRPKLIK